MTRDELLELLRRDHALRAAVTEAVMGTVALRMKNRKEMRAAAERMAAGLEAGHASGSRAGAD